MRNEFFEPLHLSAGLHVSAARTPEKIALRVGARALTYRELGTRTAQVASQAVDNLQIRHGDRVAVAAPNCLEYAELVCGLSDAGAVVATLNPRANAAEIAAACDDCRAKAVFFHSTLAAAVVAAKFAKTTRRIEIGPQYETWLAQATGNAVLPRIDETDPFTLVYSSGTTGRPKGILLSHRSRVLTFHAMAMEYGCFGPQERFLGIAPLAHGAGFAFAMAALYFGGYIEIVERFDAASTLSKLATEKFTGVFLVPTHLQSIFSLDSELLARYRGAPPGLRAMISNAAALPQPLKEKITAYFGGGLLHETYGSTEAGIVTNIRPDDQLRKPHSVGLPFATTEIRLLDDSGVEVATGEAGELYSRSPYLFNGYMNQPEETAACSRNGWVSAGDVARRDADGFIYIVDRKKDMVISGGINIYPREIEEVLNRHRDVIESAVVGIPDDHWGERLRAFVVPRAGSLRQPEPLLEHCRTLLSSYKVPKEIRFIDTIPRNLGGKVLKKELRNVV